MGGGGVLSLLPFAVYLDDLFTDFEQLGVGCYCRHHSAGAIGYADDIALLAPSASSLRMMLNVCQNLASSHSLTFNPDYRLNTANLLCMYQASPNILLYLLL